MSMGSVDAEAEGRASKLDSGHEEFVWVDHHPKGLLGCKWYDDDVIGDTPSAGTGR